MKFPVILLLATLLQFSVKSYSQTINKPEPVANFTLKGRIISEGTKKPLNAVSVYLNNTSIGTYTNEQGIFILKGIPSGKFKLIASCIGYGTYAELLDPASFSGDFVISLSPQTEELKSLVVTSLGYEGWATWGKLFTEIFIGTTPNSHACVLENPEVIKFRLNADNTLSAFANVPIHIMNYALGYEINYKLEEFEFDFNSKVVIYNGYPLFKDLSLLHPKKALKYEKARKSTYQGSVMHFMRAFYSNSLEAAGFEIRSLKNISNPEKDRARKVMSIYKYTRVIDTTDVVAQQIVSAENWRPATVGKTIQITDSTDYFRKAMLLPDSVISHQMISAENIRFTVDHSTISLYSQDSMEVSYKLKAISSGYKWTTREHRHQTFPVSQFVFINKIPVYVLDNGYYYGPHDLKITGYWAWSETIATLLPFDYSPNKN
jgi:CarboxypepD_reg-like domain